MSGYIEDTLIRLKREYGKDELVQTLERQIKNKDLEIGKLNSEILHLEEEIRTIKLNGEINKESLIKARREELYKNLLTINKNLVKKNRDLKKMNADLIYRLCQKNNTTPEQETGIKEDF